jgi:hypothetical protein
MTPQQRIVANRFYKTFMGALYLIIVASWFNSFTWVIAGFFLVVETTIVGLIWGGVILWRANR